MLKKLRNKKTARKIWIGLAIIIIPAFVLWGAGNMVRNREETGYAGKIFGRPITMLEYKDAYEAERIRAMMQLGDSYKEMEKYLNLESRAWQRIILLSEARKRRLTVNDKEVIDLIESYPFFQGNSGFDSQRYPEIVHYVFHIQPRAFEEQARQNLLMSKLFESVTDKITLAEDEIKEEYRKANEEISLDYIQSQSADFSKDIAPDEGNLRDYFTQNSLEFRQPLSFNLEYLALPQGGNDEITMQERVKKIYARLANKESFASLSKELGIPLKETGLFAETDPIPGIGWLPSISTQINKTKQDDYLPPTFSDKTFYILKVKQRKEPQIPEFQTVKDKVKTGFIEFKAKEMAEAKIQECLKWLKNTSPPTSASVDFEKAAQNFALKSSSTAFFKFKSYIEGIGASDVFWLTADKLKEGEFSEILNTPKAFYIIKLKSKKAIDEKKFSEEKAEFTKKLLLQKKQDYFTRFVTELQDKSQRF